VRAAARAIAIRHDQVERARTLWSMGFDKQYSLQAVSGVSEYDIRSGRTSSLRSLIRARCRLTEKHLLVPPPIPQPSQAA
jgi:hypothetical protein